MLLALALVTAGGCSSLKKFFEVPPYAGPVKPGETTTEPRHEAPKTPPGDPAWLELAKARDLIMIGRYAPAGKMLTNLAAGARKPGITDEALFHLGIATMKEESDNGDFQRSRQVFDRLAREYPDSVWGTEASLLSELLDSFTQAEVSLDKTKRQVKALKDSNLSLSRENKELRLNIEKLKSLDLELEHKSRR